MGARSFESRPRSQLAILLLGSDRSQSQIEFGAHQAVIVRTQEAKESLPEEFDGALVLTIFESKGLEFDDVFIYNFFADSPADEKTWRVVTSWWEQHASQQQQVGRDDLEIPAPRAVPFNKGSHGILEEELKQLYTAITRARVRVAMYDASEEKRKPVFSFLHAEGLAEIEAVGESQRGQRKGWAVAAAKEEWQTRARNLVENKLYKLAVKCFVQAEDRHGMLTALGNQLSEEASKLPTGPAQRLRYLRSAMAFDSAVQAASEATGMEQAAKALYLAEEWELAAMAFEALGNVNLAAKVLSRGAAKQPRKHFALMAEAANVYERAGRLKEALSVRLSHKEHHSKALDQLEAITAECPERVEMLQFAFGHLKRKKNWPAALQVHAWLRAAGVAIESAEVDRVAQTAAYTHRKNLKEARERKDGARETKERRLMLEAVKQFSKPKAQSDFLEDVGEMASAIELLMEQGHHEKALTLMFATSDRRAGDVARNLNDISAEGLAILLNARSQRDADGRCLGITDDGRDMTWFLHTWLGVLPYCSCVRPARKIKHVWQCATSRCAFQRDCLVAHSSTPSEHLQALLALDILFESTYLTSLKVPGSQKLGLLRVGMATAKLAIDLTSSGFSHFRAQCTSFLRGGTDAVPRPDMPTWQWLCDLSGHEVTKPLLIQEGEFTSLLCTALQSLATRWQKRVPQLIVACHEPLIQCPKHGAKLGPRDVIWSREYCTLACAELELWAETRNVFQRRQSGRPHPMVQQVGTSVNICVWHILTMLFPGYMRDPWMKDKGYHQGSLLLEGLAPFLHNDARMELKVRALQQLGPILSVVEQWWANARKSDLHWRLPIVSLLFKLCIDLLRLGKQSGLNPLKMFHDKMLTLESDALRDRRYQREGFPRFFTRTDDPRSPGKSPGVLLHSGAYLVGHGARGNLANGTRCFIDFLELNAHGVNRAATKGDPYSQLFMAAPNLCADLIEQVLSIALVVFSQRLGLQLLLPESIASTALSSASFAECAKMTSDQVVYMHKRLRDALRLMRTLRLLDSSNAQSLVERMMVISINVLLMNHVVQLKPYDYRDLHSPLRALLSSSLSDSVVSSELNTIVAAESPHSMNLWLPFQQLLRKQHNTLVKVSISSDGKDSNRVSESVDDAFLEQLWEREQRKQAPLLLPPQNSQRAHEQQSRPRRPANAFGALEQEDVGADDAADEPDAGDDDIEAALSLLQKKDSASASIQAVWRMALAWRELKRLRSKAKAQQVVSEQLRAYDNSLESLRREHGQSASLASYSERLKRFEPERMKQAGHCMWCGTPWADGHVSFAGPHFGSRMRFLEIYLPFVSQHSAPALLEMDSLMKSTRSVNTDELTEEQAQGLLQARDTLESQHASLVSALDDTEKRCEWDAPKVATSILVTTSEQAKQAVRMARDVLDTIYSQPEDMGQSGLAAGSADEDAAEEAFFDAEDHDLEEALDVKETASAPRGGGRGGRRRRGKKGRGNGTSSS